MKTWSISEAKQAYNILEWSHGYFDINEAGQVVVVAQPGSATHVPLVKLIEAMRKEGLALPLLVRFSHILHHRIDLLHTAFQQAAKHYDYQGGYTSVYPIKVNQQHSVVEELVRHGGARVGLEAGSRPELLAVMASALPGSMIVCNGYKDRATIRLALLAQKLGHRAFIVIEKLNELTIVLQEAEHMQITPQLGLRVRLASLGKGKWQNTGGEKSKFGLSATQVITAIDQLRAAGQLASLQLLHAHLGSQIANIRDIQRGARECARYFVTLRQLGAPLQVVDVGGGLGVDYEGTQSRSFCSMNYSVQEYADNIVRVFAEACREHTLAHPHIITEAGRAMTAHHAVLITDVIDVEIVAETHDHLRKPSPDDPSVLHELWQAWENLHARYAAEAYHNAVYYMGEAQTMYVHGVLSLQQWASAEQLYFALCKKIQAMLHSDAKAHRDILDELNEKLADKLFCNFSLFQSIPDAWAIDQIFPILPLSGLQHVPSRRAIIQDLTCDSDGRIEQYVDGSGIETSLPLPPYETQQPYLLGFFMVGAYQEILGDMHNLFGDTPSVQVTIDPQGHYHFTAVDAGDTVADLLRYVHFDPDQMLQIYQQKLATADLNEVLRQNYLSELQDGLSGLSYLTM